MQIRHSIRFFFAGAAKWSRCIQTMNGTESVLFIHLHMHGQIDHTELNAMKINDEEIFDFLFRPNEHTKWNVSEEDRATLK